MRGSSFNELPGNGCATCVRLIFDHQGTRSCRILEVKVSTLTITLSEMGKHWKDFKQNDMI